MSASILRDLGYATWHRERQKHQQWMSKKFEEHLLQVFTQAGEFCERDPKLRDGKKNPDYLIRDATNGAPCYVEAKAVYDGEGEHTYYNLCFELELMELRSVNGIGIGLRHKDGELQQIPSKREIGGITDWLTSVDRSLVFNLDFPSRHFVLGDAKYEVTAISDDGTGKLLRGISYSKSRTVIPDLEDPLDKIVRQVSEDYTADLLGGIPLVLAFLNCSTHKPFHGMTESYGSAYLTIDRASGEVVDKGMNGLGFWRTNRRREEIGASIPAVWVWTHATDETPTLYTNPDLADLSLPSSLFGFEYWKRVRTEGDKIEMERRVGSAVHPEHLNRAFKEYVNLGDELRGDAVRHPEVRLPE